MCELLKGEKTSPRSGILWWVHREQWCQNMISWRLGSGTIISAFQRWIINLKERWTRRLRAQDLFFLGSKGRVTSKILYASSLQRLSGRDQRDSWHHQDWWRWHSIYRARGLKPGIGGLPPARGSAGQTTDPDFNGFLFLRDVHSCDIGLCLTYLSLSLSLILFFPLSYTTIRNELLLCIILPSFFLKHLLW